MTTLRRHSCHLLADSYNFNFSPKKTKRYNLHFLLSKDNGTSPFSEELWKLNLIETELLF